MARGPLIRGWMILGIKERKMNSGMGGPCKDGGYTCERTFLEDHEEVMEITYRIDLCLSLMGISFTLKSHDGRRHLGKNLHTSERNL